MPEENLPLSPNLHTVAKRLGLDPEQVTLGDVLGYIDTLKWCLNDSAKRVSELLRHMPRDPEQKATRPLLSRREEHLHAIHAYRNYATREKSNLFFV